MTVPPTDVASERRVLRAPGFVPVEAKLRPPPERGDQVLRGHLVDRLLDAADVPVVLVTGPRGYGKTALVAQWAAEDDRPFAWLTLDSRDADPGVFLTYLLLALQRVEDVDPAVLSAFTDDAKDPTGRAVPRLARMLRARRRPFVLVLVGLDRIDSVAVDALVLALADSVPAGSQLVVVGRTPPRLPLDRLRAEGRLLELGGQDLRLTRAEVQALAEAAGLHLDDADVEELLERTEGWAAGVYLALLTLSSRGTRTPTVDDVVGSDSLIASYLRDELLADLTAEDQDFLLRTSVLGELSGPVCDALLQAPGSAAVLTRLSSSNLLVEPLDDQGTRFRMHPLLADALRAELARRDPQAVKRLHGRASRWLEDHGDLDAAVDHAIAAEETERAARLVWTRVPGCLASGRLDRLQAWLGAFTPREVAAHAKLALTAAAATLQSGGSPEHWLSSAEHGRYEADRPGESASVAAGAALLRAVIGGNGALQMGADARLAMSLMEPDDPWRCTAGAMAAVSTLMTGERETARAELAAVEQGAAATGMHQCGALALTELAVMAVEDEDWERTQALVERAASSMREHGFGSLMSMLPLHCLVVLLAARRGDPGADSRGQRLAAEVAQRVRTPVWLGAQAWRLLAEARLQLGDSSGARTLLSEAQKLVAQVQDAPHLRTSLAHTWQRVERMPLDLAGGASTLTSAELRVLQLLPTHLSFEEIGRQLFVSRNTVKTQAVAVYRKLGVGSRNEAVERATGLGLLCAGPGWDGRGDR